MKRKQRLELKLRGFEFLGDDFNAKLSISQLAEALYEGSPHLQNLAEKLARQHGEAEALCFFQMQDEDVKAFWCDIAQQLINHAKEWGSNQGSACILSKKERNRLHTKYFKERKK